MVKHKCKQDPFVWHKWWAWHPVRIDDETPSQGRICWTIVWFDYVMRKEECYYSGCGWVYKLIDKE